MQLRYFYILFFLLIINNISYSQLEADNWVFRNTNYVTFNGATTPTNKSYPSGINIFEMSGSSSVSDKNGNLLFVITGSKLYDKNFNIFPSVADAANELKAIVGADAFAATFSQPNIIIPFPGRDSMYIVFHVYSRYSNTYNTPLYYTVINMKLRGGLGEVEPGMKNILLLGGTPINLQITASLHCNKTDIWFVGHYLNSDKFFSLLVTSTGVSNTPNIFAGNLIPFNFFNPLQQYFRLGCMKVSPMGNKLAAAHLGQNFTELFDFNNSTGIGSNIKKIITAPNPGDTVTLFINRNEIGPYGIEFSPSSEFLYIVSRYSKTGIGMLDHYFFQYNVNYNTELAVQNSQYFIALKEEVIFGAMQLANNGKIYINDDDNLIEIGKPNLQGAACQYNGVINFSNVIAFYNYNLPNFLQSYFRYPVIAVGNCQFQNMAFSILNPIGVTSIAWDFGDVASGANNTSNSFSTTHIFSGQGSYMVKAVLQNSNGCAPDTIRKIVYAGQYGVNLGNDTSFCRGDSIRLTMSFPLGRTTWSNGNTDTVIYVNTPGTYWVRINLGECVASDTIIITEASLPQFNLGADTVICNNALITLKPNINFSNSTYLWSDATTLPTNTINNAGLHWLQITNATGCIWRDSINVSFKTLPNYTLGNDTSFCQKDTVILNATVTGATSYNWNTGATTPTIKAYSSNTYWCAVNKEGCIYTDTINVLVKPLPTVNLGNDTTICEDKTYTLNATNNMAQYLWQNGSTNANFTISQARQYYVKVIMQGCISNDTVNIQYQLKPRFSLGADKIICIGQAFILNPNINTTSLQYLWQDGSINNTFVVTQQGRYYVDISNNCGSTRDEVVFTNGLCKVYIPNAFTPNNDGLNDIFKIGGGETIKDFKMVIYNRWGNKIFETQNILQGWNGTLNNKPQPTGSYIYKVSFKDGVTNEPQYYSGTVTLLR